MPTSHALPRTASRLPASPAPAGVGAAPAALLYFGLGLGLGACSDGTTAAGDLGPVAVADLTTFRKLDPAQPWYGDNRTKLDDFIARTGRQSATYSPQARPVATFDWDNTVVKNDVGDATVFFMLRNNKVLQPPMKSWKLVSPFLTVDAATALSAACDAAAAAGQPLPTTTSSACATELVTVYTSAKTTGGKAAFSGWDYRRMEPAYAFAAQLLSGYTPDEARQIGGSAVAEALAAAQGTKLTIGTVTGLTGWVRIYEPIKDLIGTLKDNGFDVWIVSASPQPVVEAAAVQVGVAADHVIGIRLLQRSGKLSYDIQGCGDVPDGQLTATGNQGNSLITYIDGKRCWINKVIYGNTSATATNRSTDPSKRTAFAAGDSDTDITFLQDTVGMRLTLNRNKKELMCNAYRNAHGTWLVNPMFIEPLPKLTAGYACSTTACKDSGGTSVPCRDEDGAVIPDQMDTVFMP